LSIYVLFFNNATEKKTNAKYTGVSMRSFTALWTSFFGAPRPARRPQARRRLQAETLEDRCVPAATSNPFAGSALVTPPAAPTAAHTTLDRVASKDGLQIARGQSTAIANSIRRLQRAQLRHEPGSLSRGLLGQNIALLKQEQASMNRMIKHLKTARPKLTRDQGIVKVFALEAKFAHANAALQAFQTGELLAGRLSRFRPPVRFF
jgi:hypothetical protein